LNVRFGDETIHQQQENPDALQKRSSVKNVLQQLDADIYAVEEV
jgi:hypothetical protein